MAETVRTRHTISGVINENTPIHDLENPAFGKYLEVVGPDAKPFVPALHKPRLAKVEKDTEPPAEAKKAEAPVKKNGKD